MRKKRVTCTRCSYKAGSTGNLKNHMVLHSEEKRYICTQCSFRTKWKHGLQRHLQTHGIKKNELHKCTTCEKSFKHKHSLIYHMNLHTGQCNYCAYKAKTEFLLKIHVETYHETRDETDVIKETFKCTACKISFDNKLSLARHMITHTTEQIIQCTECSYTTDHSSNLKRHFKVCHTDKRPFVCTLCSFASKWKHCLERHIKIHDKEKAKTKKINKKTRVRRHETDPIDTYKNSDEISLDLDIVPLECVEFNTFDVMIREEPSGLVYDCSLYVKNPVH